MQAPSQNSPLCAYQPSGRLRAPEQLHHATRVLRRVSVRHRNFPEVTEELRFRQLPSSRHKPEFAAK
ncbi:hypothetical protein FQA47_008535 [Oryzias melastigma]|uniref:Uncharacterized protein n=1 Tax=Oryzias melastigma TaxID=30732 RepID=A0A834C3Q4_ORYME|nr:hypothetical protein FQA47_008535 [Oryzias melastigma]